MLKIIDDLDLKELEKLEKGEKQLWKKLNIIILKIQ